MARLFVLALAVLALPAGSAGFAGTNGRLLFTQELERVDRYAQPDAYVCATTPSGARPTKVAEPPPGQSIEYPAVDPDGSRVAYSRVGNIFGSAPNGAGQVFIAAGTMPAWTPDGQWIYFANGGDLYSITDRMTRLTAFTTGPRYDQMPAVSPDGRTVAFVRGPGFGQTGDELVLREIATGSERVVVASPGIAAPDWSPDGARLAFALSGTISTISAGGTDLRALAGGNAGEPAYSPDGTLIAFERDGDIWTMSTNGSGLRNITRSPVAEHQPAWQTGASFTQAGSDKPCAIVGTEVGEELTGSEYDDVFYDLGGDDTVRGLGGDDRIFDGEGIDRLEGGDGSDLIILGAGANIARGGPGDDTITGGGGFLRPDPAALPQQIFGEDGADVLTGGWAGDRIEGGSGKDVLSGLKGPDILLGGTESDRLAGNRGDDTLNGNQGDDVLYGGLTTGRPLNYDGYDLLVGGEGNDRLAGGWQKDRLFGGPGNDRLSGGPNADYLLGEAGVDVFLGEAGDDLLLARDLRREHVSGGPGFDRARLDRIDRRAGVERAIR